MANLCTGTSRLFPAAVAEHLCGIAVGLVVSLVLGLCLFRLRGTYFTFSTIAVVQVSSWFFCELPPAVRRARRDHRAGTLHLFGFEFNSYYGGFICWESLCFWWRFFVHGSDDPARTRAGAVRDNETAAQTWA